MAEKRVISQELKDTVEANPGINNVFFDIKGGHHFNAFRAQAIDKKTGKLVQVDGLVAPGSGGTIVETLSREQILGTKPTEEKK